MRFRGTGFWKNTEDKLALKIAEDFMTHFVEVTERAITCSKNINNFTHFVQLFYNQF